MNDIEVALGKEVQGSGSNGDSFSMASKKRGSVS